MSIDDESRSARQRPSGAGRPVLAVLVGAVLGLIPSALLYYGASRGSDVGAGSIGLAALVWLGAAAGVAWTTFKKGWRP